MATLVDALASLITGGSAIGVEAQRPAKMTMEGVGPHNELIIPETDFQWWPESFQDSLEIGWQKKEVPGASHSVLQWGSNGGRTFTFEVVISRFRNPTMEAAPLGGVMPIPEELFEEDDHNVDIVKRLKILRAFCYPSYETGGNGVTRPPVACRLHLPGMSLNEDGTDMVMCVMTGCDITYQKTFPSGVPRLVQLSCTFWQMVQSSNGVRWKGREDLLRSAGIDMGRINNGKTRVR